LEVITLTEKKQRYNGDDPSGSWKVVSFEGKTLSSDEKLLAGFTNYRKAAQAAKAVNGVPVRG
jgi:hypothetical protein